MPRVCIALSFSKMNQYFMYTILIKISCVCLFSEFSNMQGLAKCHSRISIFFELMTKVNKNLNVECKKISTCSHNYQLNQTKKETIQQHGIIDIYEELPTKFQSLNRRKDIDVNLNGLDSIVLNFLSVALS